MPEVVLEAPGTSARLAGKYLTFVLGDVSYGLNVLWVREIIRQSAITTIPQLPPYVRGVINLRGKIVAVIDLHRRLGSGAERNLEVSCIIVVQTTLADGGVRQMGLLVDGVEEVISLAVSDIEITPELTGGTKDGVVQAVAKIKGVIKPLLDVERLVAPMTPQLDGIGTMSF